ncbi:MAG: hypothetical protein OEN20_02590 [Gammaproteobacteria bacterium]|nr:hypothetical protein [Gammaproteobacteria bacterium]
MTYSTGAMQVAENIRLTVSSGAWEYLSAELDPNNDVLVFVWGTCGMRNVAAWSASVYPRDELPMTANQRTVGTKLGKVTVAIPQRQHLNKLDGRTLSMLSDSLVVV